MDGVSFTQPSLEDLLMLKMRKLFNSFYLPSFWKELPATNFGELKKCLHNDYLAGNENA